MRTAPFEANRGWARSVMPPALHGSRFSLPRGCPADLLCMFNHEYDAQSYKVHMTGAATNEGWNVEASLGRVNRSPFNAHSSPGRARPAGLQSQPAVSRTAGGYSTPDFLSLPRTECVDQESPFQA